MLKVNYDSGGMRLTVDSGVLDKLSVEQLAQIVLDLSSSKLAIMFTKLLTDNLDQAKMDKLGTQCGVILAQCIAEDKRLALQDFQERAIKPMLPTIVYDTDD